MLAPAEPYLLAAKYLVDAYLLSLAGTALTRTAECISEQDVPKVPAPLLLLLVVVVLSFVFHVAGHVVCVSHWYSAPRLSGALCFPLKVRQSAVCVQAFRVDLLVQQSTALLRQGEEYEAQAGSRAETALELGKCVRASGHPHATPCVCSFV